ncbi:MAG: hypothetical protein ACP5R6_01270 [Chlorobaculum sp.]
MRVLFLAEGVALFEAIAIDPCCFGIAGNPTPQPEDAFANNDGKDRACPPKNKLCKIRGYCRYAQEFMATGFDLRWKLSDLLLIITPIDEQQRPRLIASSESGHAVTPLFNSAPMHSDDFNAYHERLFIQTIYQAAEPPAVFCAVCIPPPGRDFRRAGRSVLACHQWP